MLAQDTRDLRRKPLRDGDRQVQLAGLDEDRVLRPASHPKVLQERLRALEAGGGRSISRVFLGDGLDELREEAALRVREAPDLVQDVELLHAPQQGHLVAHDHVVRRAAANNLRLADYQAVPLGQKLHLVGDGHDVCQAGWDLRVDLVEQLLLVRGVDPAVDGPGLFAVLVGGEPLPLEAEARLADIHKVLQLPPEAREERSHDNVLPSVVLAAREERRLEPSQRVLGADDVVFVVDHEADGL
mmetsp:Transcript_118628/g.369568  ORF Transcript_118628/g.369568 Transcript_118628/m.369568 type:complete len:243 (+) Transcript_118628:283-1011(+)